MLPDSKIKRREDGCCHFMVVSTAHDVGGPRYVCMLIFKTCTGLLQSLRDSLILTSSTTYGHTYVIIVLFFLLQRMCIYLVIIEFITCIATAEQRR
jgi:hypothetical protein